MFTPVPFTWAMEGPTGVQLFPTISDKRFFVPPNEVWVVEAAAVSTYENRPCDYALQLDQSVPTGSGIYYFALEKTSQPTQSTPALTLSRRIILMPGQRLSARVNGPSDFARLVLTYTGWKLPIEALPHLILNF